MLSAVIVYEPAFVISYVPVTASPLTLMVNTPSVSTVTSIVMLSPTLASVIGVISMVAFLMPTKNTSLYTSDLYSSFSFASTVTL